METERVAYRWWVLVNTFLIFTVTFGMGWTYIVMLVSQVLQDLGLALSNWGALWSAISFGTMLSAIIGGFVAPLICAKLVNLNPVAGFAFGGGCYALSGLLFLLLKETGPRVRALG